MKFSLFHIMLLVAILGFVSPMYATDMQVLLQKHKQGTATADDYYELANLYNSRGEGTTAIQYWNIAAEKGNPHAQAILVTMSWGIVYEAPNAPAKLKGNTGYWMAKLYYNGNCRATDVAAAYAFCNQEAEAIQWYQRAYYTQGLTDTEKAKIEAYLVNKGAEGFSSPSSLYTQNSPTIQSTNYDKDKKISPAIISYIEGSLQFIDNTKNNAIDANETCYIRFKIKNEGNSEGNNCVAKVSMSGTTAGIRTESKRIDHIKPNDIIDVEIPITSNIQTQAGQVIFSIEVTEPNGFGTDPIELAVATKAFNAPYLKIVDYAVTGSRGGTLNKKSPFNLQLMLQNTKYGKAEDVEVNIEIPDNVFLMDGNKKVHLESLDGGKAKSIDYQLIVANNYVDTQIPINVIIKEKYGKYTENKTINLQLNQTLASTKLNVQAIEEHHQQEIQLATIGSAVDKNIPVNKIQNKNTFALIIANENYQQVSSVPFALNDGNIFREYCEKTLGIPTQNIHFVADATLNNIRSQIDWLSQVIDAYNGKAKVIFYYAGHGVPDEKSKTAFLLPVDGNGSDMKTGYQLDDLYKTLGNIPSEAVTILLDACFSGSKREEGMLASARGVAIKAKSGQPIGNMVVFTAATGDETAYPNNDEGHGMFTYYLLKKLQETAGNVTYEELGRYIQENVRQQSIVLNGKSQTPTVNASSSANGWQEWKLK